MCFKQVQRFILAKKCFAVVIKTLKTLFYCQYLLGFVSIKFLFIKV